MSDDNNLYIFSYRAVPGEAGLSPPNHEQGKLKYILIQYNLRTLIILFDL